MASMQGYDISSQVFNDDMNRRLFKLWAGGLVVYVVVTIIAYTVSLSTPQNGVSALLASAIVAQIKEAFPLDYWRFLRSSNPSAAGRVWLVEFVIWAMAAGVSLFLLFVYGWHILRDRDTRGKLVERPFVFKEVIVGVFGPFIMPLCFVSYLGDALINDNSRRALGPNDMILFMHWIGGFMTIMGFNLLWILLFAACLKLAVRLRLTSGGRGD